MSEVVEQVSVNIPAPGLDDPQVADSVELSAKYVQERDKRVRQDALGQFIDLSTASARLQSLLEDPWVEAGAPVHNPVSEGGHCKFLIVGAGFGGLLFAVKLIKAGYQATDIMLIDPAGGFGGTWYKNRYPGLMCDVESYIYLPMLEEMDYIPKRKYSSGSEILAYAESIATKYDLHERAMFQSSVDRTTWNAASKEWNTSITQKPKGDRQAPFEMSSSFVIIATGVLNNPKLPHLRGSDTFSGEMFHTSRWDYRVTGGSPTDQDLTGLTNKRVGIIGTGATAVQAVPHLAKWSKELLVFQRTPSSVDARNNRDTDISSFKSETASKPGWQRRRNENFVQFTSNHDPKPEVNMVDDEWTNMPSYSALVGAPKNVTMETVGEHVTTINALDASRQTRVRARAAEIIKDPKTAQNLQAWYPGWCKRPCFHDEYLPSFNLPNVQLIDTDGKGVDRISEKGVVFNGKEYEIDVLIWGTGYGLGYVGLSKGAFEVIGKDGIRLDDQFEKGWSTLHGVISRGFPNMFWPGPLQAGVNPNFMFVLDMLSTHVAYIVAKVDKQAGGKPVVEPSAEAVEEWAMQIMSRALNMAAMSGCTPSYLNGEGTTDRMTPEQQMKAARASTWGTGMLDYLGVIEGWRADDKLMGLEVTAQA